MIYTGFRIGEMVALKASDINLDEGYIVGGEKTAAGRNRVVPIPPNVPELTEFLRTWVSESVDGVKLFKPMGEFRSDFYAALAEYGFTERHYTPHSTRHTFASLSSAAGMKPENLQKIIGHSNFSTTANIYLHQDIETLRSEMSKISK